MYIDLLEYAGFVERFRREKRVNLFARITLEDQHAADHVFSAIIHQGAGRKNLQRLRFQICPMLFVEFGARTIRLSMQWTM